MSMIETSLVFSKTIPFVNCRLNVEVYLKKPSNSTNQYYHIDYLWTYQTDIRDHPLYLDKVFIESHLDGEILVKNQISDSFVNMLGMSDIELKSCCGNKSVTSYRISIIKAISLFWD